MLWVYYPPMGHVCHRGFAKRRSRLCAGRVFVEKNRILGHILSMRPSRGQATNRGLSTKPPYSGAGEMRDRCGARQTFTGHDFLLHTLPVSRHAPYATTNGSASFRKSNAPPAAAHDAMVRATSGGFDFSAACDLRECRSAPCTNMWPCSKRETTPPRSVSGCHRVSHR